MLPVSKQGHYANSFGNPFTIFTVSTLTRITCPTRRTMYCGSSSRLGSEVMPLRLSVQTWHWSMTHSRAERFPRRYSNASGGMPASVSDGLTVSRVFSLLIRGARPPSFWEGQVSRYVSVCSHG